jgi:hypothetical protein
MLEIGFILIGFMILDRAGMVLVSVPISGLFPVKKAKLDKFYKDVGFITRPRIVFIVIGSLFLSLSNNEGSSQSALLISVFSFCLWFLLFNYDIFRARKTWLLGLRPDQNS